MIKVQEDKRKWRSYCGVCKTKQDKLYELNLVDDLGNGQAIIMCNSCLNELKDRIGNFLKNEEVD